MSNLSGLGLHAAILSATAVILHGIWEYVQCPLFFIHLNVPATFQSMMLATGGDVLLTWLAQIFIGLLTRKWLWTEEPWSLKEWTALLGSAIVLSLVMEWHGLSTRRWTYTEMAPLIPGLKISVIPVLQLFLLFPITFAITGHLMRKAMAP